MLQVIHRLNEYNDAMSMTSDASSISKRKHFRLLCSTICANPLLGGGVGFAATLLEDAWTHIGLALLLLNYTQTHIESLFLTIKPTWYRIESVTRAFNDNIFSDHLVLLQLLSIFCQ